VNDDIFSCYINLSSHYPFLDSAIGIEETGLTNIMQQLGQSWQIEQEHSVKIYEVKILFDNNEALPIH
jgi:hypothetical protein